MINVFGSKVGEGAIERVAESIRKQWLGMGPNVNEFERRFAERLKLPNFALVDSGSNALYLAITLLDLPKGSEIIVPSFTWVSCAQAVLLAGHKPVFADVDLITNNITAELAAKQITQNTRAIMVVHYAGLPVDIDPILALGYPVVEDAAHAVDSLYKGRPCGGIGDVGIYSFDAVKNLSMGEGGGVTVSDQGKAGRATILRYCGIGKSGFEASTHGKKRWWEYNIQEPFIKMNPSDIQAAIGLDQLEHLNELQAYRKHIFDIYQEELGKISWITLPVDANEGDRHSYFTYNIRVPKRDDFAKFMFDNGIYTTLRYHPLHLNALYNSKADLPNCMILNEEAISIPLHPNLSESDINKIIETIKRFGTTL